MRILLSASKEGMKLSGGINPAVCRGVVWRMLAGRIFSYGELGRVLEGRETGTGEGDTCCLEAGRVCPLRMLKGGTFSDGWMLCNDGGGKGTGVGDGVARCLEDGLV